MGICKIVDGNGDEAVTLNVSGSRGISFDPTKSFKVSSLFQGKPDVSIDFGGELLWKIGGDNRFTIDQLDGMSVCDSNTLVFGVGATDQHCWGPSNRVAYDLETADQFRDGVHSQYVGVAFGTPNFSSMRSLSYSVSFGCGAWYSLTLQVCSPSNGVPPSIPSGPTVAQPVAADPGTWAAGSSGPAFNLTYNYQWLRCPSSDASSCQPITAETGVLYTPTEADRGAWLTVQVSAANSGGTSAPVVGALQGPVQ